MFSFAFPLFLAGAALTAVPLLLHFLRKRISKVQDFPSLYFLRQTVARKKTRNDLRSWLVFLLRALALCCLAAAFAWPRFDTPDDVPEEASVFILDASYSTANPEFRTQLKSLLEKQLSSVSVERPAVGLIAADRMTVSGDFVSDRSVLEDFFRTFGDPQPVSSDFSLALYRADRLLAGIRAGKRRIVIFTDRQRLPWNRMPEKPFLHYADEVVILPETIREPSNARILSAARFRGELKVSLLCTGGKELHGEVELLTIQGKSLWKQAVTLPSGRNTALSIPLKGKLADEEAGHLVLHCKDDPCPADNEWFFPPVPKADRSVQVFSSVRFPALKAALDASGIRFSESEEWPAQAPDMLFVGDSPLSDADTVRGRIDDILHAGTSVVLLYQDTPFMRALFERFGAAFDTGNQPAASAQLQSIDLEHPVFREYRDLGSASWFDLLFFHVPKIRLPEGAHVIAEWEGGAPAIAELPRNGGKLFFFAFAPDPRQTNFQTSGHFLPFFRELLEYGAVSSSKRVMFTAAGKTVRTPDGELDLRTPGIQRLGSTLYCVNADRTESETAVIPDGFSVIPGEKKTADTVSAAKKAFPFDAANPMLLFACAIALLLAESGISNRTAL